ncbi:MAG: glycosyltransferase family 2 protein [Thermoguttaceae bacterium]
MPLITLIIPCYNEEASLSCLYDALNEVADQIFSVYSDTQFEFVFIDDGSNDNTLPLLVQLCEKDSRVSHISFSRNFGKEAAIYAGLEVAKGDCVALVDADMQDPPSLLLEMYRYIRENEYDQVATRRVNRKGEPPIRSLFARMFYHLINRISKTEFVDGARDFRLMKRICVDAILSMQEYNRFSKGIFSWVGFKTKWLEYENINRVAGETKWSFWSLFVYSINGITAFSTVPLVISTLLGFLFCTISLLAIVVLCVRQLVWENSAFGWTSSVSIFFFMSGIQLFCIGILGQYISKIYLETKKRPHYIVKQKFDASQRRLEIEVKQS